MNRLRVNPKFANELLSPSEFTSLSTEELLYRARVRLGLARCGTVRGIAVTDRLMAIAVLVAISDRTEYGLLRRDPQAEERKQAIESVSPGGDSRHRSRLQSMRELEVH